MALEGSVVLSASVRNPGQAAGEFDHIGDSVERTGAQVLEASRRAVQGHREAEAASRAQAAAERALTEAARAQAASTRVSGEAARTAAAQQRALMEAERAATAAAQRQAAEARAAAAELARQAAAARDSARASREAERASTGHSQMLSGLMSKLGALAAAYLSVNFVIGKFREGIAYNAQMEGLQLGITSIVSANEQIIDGNGRQLEGIEKINAAQSQVAEVFAQLKKDAIDTTATLPQLANAFNAAVGPALAMGLSLDQTRKLTVAMVQTMGAMQIPLDQARQEVTSILQGTISQDSMMAKQLNLSNQQIAQWKEQGVLADKLLDKMRDFTAAGELAGKTWSGLTSTMEENVNGLVGKMSAPLMEVAKETIEEFNGLFEGESGEALNNVAYQFGGIIADGLSQAKLIAADLGNILLYAANKYANLIREGRLNAAANDPKPFTDAMKKRLPALDSSLGPGIGNSADFTAFKALVMRGTPQANLEMFAKKQFLESGGSPKVQSRNKHIYSQLLQLMRSASMEAAGVRQENLNSIADSGSLTSMAKGGHKYVPNKPGDQGHGGSKAPSPEKIKGDQQALARELGVISKTGLDKELEQEAQWYEGKKKLAHGHKDLLRKLDEEHAKRQEDIRSKYRDPNSSARGLQYSVGGATSNLGSMELNLSTLASIMNGGNSKLGLASLSMKGQAPAGPKTWTSGDTPTDVKEEWYAPIVQAMESGVLEGGLNGFRAIVSGDFGGFADALFDLMGKAADPLISSLAGPAGLAFQFGTMLYEMIAEAGKRAEQEAKDFADHMKGVREQFGLGGEKSAVDKAKDAKSEDEVLQGLLKKQKELRSKADSTLILNSDGTVNKDLTEQTKHNLRAEAYELERRSEMLSAEYDAAITLATEQEKAAKAAEEFAKAAEAGAARMDSYLKGKDSAKDAYNEYLVATGQKTKGQIDQEGYTDVLSKNLSRINVGLKAAGKAELTEEDLKNNPTGAGLLSGWTSKSMSATGLDYGTGDSSSALLMEAIAAYFNREASKTNEAKAMPGSSPQNPAYFIDVTPRKQFAFQQDEAFFRNREAGTARSLRDRSVFGK